MEANNNQKKKEVTNEDLARLMAEGFEKSAKLTDEKIEELARIVQGGFLSVGERFDGVEKRLDTIEAEINKKVNKIDHNTFKHRIEKLEEKFA